MMVVLGIVISLALVSIILVAGSWVARIIAEVLFVFILLVIRVIILTFVIWIPNACFIYFYFILTWCDIYVVDIMDFPFIDALFGDDVRLKIHSFLECCV